LYFLPLLLTHRNRNHIEVVAYQKRWPSLKALLQIAVTFWLTVLAWVFFRAENITHALQYLRGVFSKSIFSLPEIRPTNLILLIAFFIGVEWLGRQQKHALETLLLERSRILRWGFYMCLITIILIFSNAAQQEFIYFQF
jgi:hypothetical protein